MYLTQAGIYQSNLGYGLAWQLPILIMMDGMIFMSEMIFMKMIITMSTMAMELLQKAAQNISVITAASAWEMILLIIIMMASWMCNCRYAARLMKKY